jgi:hypothetical protein
VRSLYSRFDEAKAIAGDDGDLNAELSRGVFAWISDRLAQPDVPLAFKRAWLAADDRGESGSRVTAGLAAVAEQVRTP